MPFEPIQQLVDRIARETELRVSESTHLIEKTYAGMFRTAAHRASYDDGIRACVATLARLAARKSEHSASKGIDRWEDEGGNVAPPSDGFDLKNSTLADNAGWRADRRRGRLTAASRKPK